MNMMIRNNSVKLKIILNNKITFKSIATQMRRNMIYSCHRFENDHFIKVKIDYLINLKKNF